MFLMHHSLVSKCLGQRPESKISRVTVDNITFSVFSKVRENSLSNVICSSQPHYAVKRWKYKAGTWMEISDSEQRLERWCLHCSVQMLVSQKLIFHCSLALLYFFFFFYCYALTYTANKADFLWTDCLSTQLIHLHYCWDFHSVHSWK